jgi:hypothetical protein
MTEAPIPRRSPYAVPYDALVADSRTGGEETVVEAIHEPPPDYGSVGDAAGDGD